MAQQALDLDGITADALAGLTGDGARSARLAQWSAEDAAREAASLANAGGGLIVVGPQQGLSEQSLLAAGDSIQPGGRELLRARVLDTPEGPVGLIAVRECADPPAMASDDGAIYSRGAGGAERVRSRADLEELLAKRQRLRERAERVIDAQLERTAFGHSSYYALALVVTPLLGRSGSLEWARANRQAVLDSAMARRWGMAPSEVVEEGSVIEFRREADDTPFILAAGNGTLAIGERDKRPSQDHFHAAADLAARLEEFAAVAQLLLRGGDAGLVLPALFIEGFRGLRLQAGDGYGPPASKDLQRSFLAPCFAATDAGRDALVAEMRDVLGPVLGADLAAGTVEAFEGPLPEEPSARTWHGKTLRTERRLAGQRGFGSAR